MKSFKILYQLSIIKLTPKKNTDAWKTFQKAVPKKSLLM